MRAFPQMECLAPWRAFPGAPVKSARQSLCRPAKTSLSHEFFGLGLRDAFEAKHSS